MLNISCTGTKNSILWPFSSYHLEPSTNGRSSIAALTPMDLISHGNPPCNSTPASFSLPYTRGHHWHKTKNLHRSRALSITASAASTEISSFGVDEEAAAKAKASGTTARGRRLLKLREEKRKREFDRLNNYPSWAKVLENACKNDTELRAVLGDSIGNPELMRKKVEERVRKKGRDFTKARSGSVLAFKVSFRDFNPVGSYIWFELLGSPSARDVDLIGSIVQAWYVMGRLGAFNSSNLQLESSSMDYDPLYDVDKGSKVMPSSFHDIGDVEFQDNWGRFWIDMGTADFFSIDVLLNCLTTLSSEYVGIQQVVFGGRQMGDWEDGMTRPEDGYTSFKI